ncbi:pentapeptide repeat-containing protein [Streptomyces asoensis]|uniref:pentapeptide repeat-containing protein n=1 Tax=Streptomyces asoensis TaxID=249586 RepID=UPI0033E2C554
MGTLAALGTLAAILLTWVSLQQVDNEQALTREGQVTDRYNAAVGNIGDEALEVRLGGIYALQRIMQDSPRDQPSIVDVLSTYIRTHSKKRQDTAAYIQKPAGDVRAALAALFIRDYDHDGTARVDLHNADLTGADLKGAHLANADLTGVDLARVDLSGADLTGADLAYADLTAAKLHSTDLTHANLNLVHRLSDVDLADVNLSGAGLSGVDLSGSVLRKVDLSQADLSGANLSDSALSAVELSEADLSGADMSRVDLEGVDLTGVKR